MRTLYFLGLVVIIGLLFQYFFEKNIILGSESSGSYKVNRVLHGDDENEIPIFGASTAQGGFIPGILGPAYFNYGIDGIKEDVILFFLEQECKKVKKNPNIIVVLSLEGFTHGLGELNSYIPNSNNPGVRKLLGDNYKFYYKIPFIRYYGQYEWYVKDYLNERMMLTKYKDHGASIEKDILTKEKFQSLVEERSRWVDGFRHDSSLEKEFSDLITKNPGRHFIVVIPPAHPSYFYRYSNYDEALRYLSGLSRIPNLSVLNYSHHFYPDDCYLNTSHLNYKGAVLFNDMLKDTLQKIYSNE
jgi:hypothetical protein